MWLSLLEGTQQKETIQQRHGTQARQAILLAGCLKPICHQVVALRGAAGRGEETARREVGEMVWTAQVFWPWCSVERGSISLCFNWDNSYM